MTGTRGRISFAVLVLAVACLAGAGAVGAQGNAAGNPIVAMIVQVQQALAAGVSQVGAGISQIGTQLTALQASANTQQSGIGDLQTDINQLELRVLTLQAVLDVLGPQLQEHVADFDAIAGQLAEHVAPRSTLVTPAVYLGTNNFVGCRAVSATAQARTVQLVMIRSNPPAVLGAQTSTLNAAQMMEVDASAGDPDSRIFCQFTVQDGVSSDIRGAIQVGADYIPAS